MMLKSRREVLALKGFFFLFFFSFVGAVVGGLGTWSTGEGGVSVFVLLYGMVLDRGDGWFRAKEWWYRYVSNPFCDRNLAA